MTPAITVAQEAGIFYKIHEYAHDASSDSLGEDAAAKLGVPPDRVFKTLVVDLKPDDFTVAVIPAPLTLNMKRIARAAGAKKAVMADKSDVERVTGYVPGGVSPLGQKKTLKTIIDTSAEDFPTIFVSAGRRGLEIEIQPTDLQALTRGTFAALCA